MRPHKPSPDQIGTPSAYPLRFAVGTTADSGGLSPRARADGFAQALVGSWSLFWRLRPAKRDFSKKKYISLNISLLNTHSIKPKNILFTYFSLISWSILNSPIALYAQTDTLQQFEIPAIEISTIQLRESVTGEQIKRWDSLALRTYQHTHIADILGKESNIFIKSYGLGSLATSSIRGGSASHTAVLWNGFALQSPMLGLLDLSLLPAGFIDELQLQFGGNSTAWGNGAIGGAISINNRPDFRQGIRIALGNTIGSFEQSNHHVKAHYSRKDFSITTRLFYQQAKNNFPYKVRPNLPGKIQTHAALQQSGILQEAYWKVSRRQELGLQLWLQQTDREIPPTSTQNRSGAVQADDALRTGLHWKYIGNKLSVKARTGFFNEKLYYRDELIGLHSRSRFSTIIGEIESQWYFNKSQQLQVGLNYTHTEAHSAGYKVSPTQQRFGLFAAFRQSVKQWEFQLSGRQTWVDERMLPFVPSVGVEVQLNKWLKVRGKVSRNYRMPTLNDLYWQPGGNIDLQAEHGWSEEFGIDGNWKIGKQVIKYSLTGFNRNIHDWILWSIRAGQSFWSANNITEVWSRGVEQGGSWEMETNSWRLKINAAYDFILSTNQKDLQQPLMHAGDQLIYTPKHQAFGGINIQWKSLAFGYQHRYTSSVRTPNDPLPSYDLGNMHMSYSYQFKRFLIQSLFHIENIWDATYRVIERRPMPGRYYLMSLNLTWHPRTNP